MKPYLTFVICLLVACSSLSAGDDYVVLVSKATHSQPEWKKVVDKLQTRHEGQIIVYDSVADCLKPLAKAFPKYACFVATPAEANRQFVADVHRVTRKLDDDPYTDVIWGILTGYDSKCALRIASTEKPLTVNKVSSGTEIALDRCREGVWYCELQKNRMVKKEPGGKPLESKGPDDTTAAIASTLSKYKADLFVTSGHATERNWQIGFRYRNGYFVSKAGQMYGTDTQQERFSITADNPKVYMAVGNCLMGNIDGEDSMALAFMNSVGVNQMIGYTVLTWYGYGGWGCLDYFVEQPGRYTFAESFFANQQALLHRLETEYPDLARQEVPPGKTTSYQGGGGLLHDRDVVAFYGDPAWHATMADGVKNWQQRLTRKGNTYTFEIIPQADVETFKPVNTNGSQRGWRPIVHFLPHRVADVKIVDGQDWKPVVTDNFILFPNPREFDSKASYRVVFTASELTSD